MAHKKKRNLELFLRNFIFGVEDSLVSTVGLLSGVAAAGVAKQTIFLTGTVLVCVEALSMATGSFLSEHSAEEYESHREVSAQKSIYASIIMFVSYFLTGFIPLFPYLFYSREEAFGLSIAFSLGALFLLGVISGLLLHISWLRKGIEMFLLGGIAIIIGIVVGNIVNSVQ